MLPPPTKIGIETLESGLRISWEQVPGAVQYTLFWGNDRGVFKQLLHTVQNSVVISGLKPGTLYNFAVTSWTESGESGFSKESVFVYDNQPSRASVHLSTGQLLLRRGSIEDAHAYLSAAIRLDPRSPEAYRIRAQVNEKMNKPELARRDHTMAEKLFNEKPISLGPKSR